MTARSSAPPLSVPPRAVPSSPADAPSSPPSLPSVPVCAPQSQRSPQGACRVRVRVLGRVLIVDDNADLVVTLRQVLEPTASSW